MAKLNYLNRKYGVHYEYNIFTKLRTKQLNKYLLFKCIANLLEEMYYSIHCYRLINRKTKVFFLTGIKYVKMLGLFVKYYLVHFLNSWKLFVRYSQRRDVHHKNTMLIWTLNTYFPVHGVKRPCRLFVKLLLLLLQRRKVISSNVWLQRTIMYHVRKISNYLFYEKHNRLLGNIDETILGYDLRKRILNSIFNVHRYVRKYKYTSKQYIFRKLSINIALNMRRFYLLNKFKRQRYNTFFYLKLRFKQLYKVLYNFKTTRQFIQYAQFLRHRLKKFAVIGSIYYNQIYSFLHTYLFNCFGFSSNISRLTRIKINGASYNVHSHYPFIIGDRIELTANIFKWIVLMRTTFLSFIISQFLYNVITHLKVKIIKPKYINKKNLAHYIRKIMNIFVSPRFIGAASGVREYCMHVNNVYMRLMNLSPTMYMHNRNAYLFLHKAHSTVRYRRTDVFKMNYTRYKCKLINNIYKMPKPFGLNKIHMLCLLTRVYLFFSRTFIVDNAVRHHVDSNQSFSLIYQLVTKLLYDMYLLQANSFVLSIRVQLCDSFIGQILLLLRSVNNADLIFKLESSLYRILYKPARHVYITLNFMEWLSLCSFNNMHILNDVMLYFVSVMELVTEYSKVFFDLFKERWTTAAQLQKVVYESNSWTNALLNGSGIFIFLQYAKRVFSAFSYSLNHLICLFTKGFASFTNLSRSFRIVCHLNHRIKFMPKIAPLNRAFTKKKLFQMANILLRIQAASNKYRGFYRGFQKKKFGYAGRYAGAEWKNFFGYGSRMCARKEDFLTSLKKRILCVGMAIAKPVLGIYKYKGKRFRYARRMNNFDYKMSKLYNMLDYPTQRRYIISYFFRTFFGNAIHRLLVRFCMHRRKTISYNIYTRHLDHYLWAFLRSRWLKLIVLCKKLKVRTVINLNTKYSIVSWLVHKTKIRHRIKRTGYNTLFVAANILFNMYLYLRYLKCWITAFMLKVARKCSIMFAGVSKTTAYARGETSLVLNKAARLSQIKLRMGFVNIDKYLMHMRTRFAAWPLLYAVNKRNIKIIWYRYDLFFLSNDQQGIGFLKDIPVDLRYLFHTKNKSMLLTKYR